MQQYQVPQFIDVEDKIFGPLTFKQFLYVVGGGGISFVIWMLLPIYLAVLFIVPIAALSLALAFYKVNDKPFIYTLEAAVQYLLSNKLYIWKQNTKKKKQEKRDEPQKQPQPEVPKLADSKLKDLAWELDVHKRTE